MPHVTTDDKHGGLTMISVPAEVDGLEIRGIETMGGREVNDMFFTDCFVPGAGRRAQVDRAWMQLMAGLNNERLIIAAQRSAWPSGRSRTRSPTSRSASSSGSPIGSFQTLEHGSPTSPPR